nr:hypothetical protein [Tanacetum cinerariifolium]GFA46483.1 hypothetical protein [Tanacetum cinerariifolium]GFA50306.1 hypothetical protein [Tanacetum cinerariifolium]
MYDDMTYLIQLDIKDDDDVNFLLSACSSTDGIQHLYVGQPKEKEERIIPSPASILQPALIRKNVVVLEGGPEYVMPTQEYVRKIIKDASEDNHFTRGPLLSAVEYLNAEGVMVAGCLGDMKNYCKNGKLETVVGVIKSCTPNALGDLIVTLKDLLGTMGGTIHYKVFKDEEGYTKSIGIG